MKQLSFLTIFSFILISFISCSSSSDSDNLSTDKNKKEINEGEIKEKEKEIKEGEIKEKEKEIKEGGEVITEKILTDFEWEDRSDWNYQDNLVNKIEPDAYFIFYKNGRFKNISAFTSIYNGDFNGYGEWKLIDNELILYLDEGGTQVHSIEKIDDNHYILKLKSNGYIEHLIKS